MGKIIERVRKRERIAKMARMKDAAEARMQEAATRHNARLIGAAPVTIGKPAAGEVIMVNSPEIEFHHPWWAFWRRNGDGPVMDPLLATLLLLAAAMGAIGLYGGYF